MTTPANSPAKPSAGDHSHAATPAVLTFEDRLRDYWQKNGQAIMVGAGIVILGVLAKGVWDYVGAQKELEVEKEFAAATTPDKLKAFAASHAGHSLAAVAQLQVADESYAAGKSAEAISGYEQVISILKSGPLASRAKLGVAMAKLQAGKDAEGEAALKAIAADANEAKATRIEACYQLASLASVLGRTDDVQKYSEQVMQLDPVSPWTQRVYLLRATMPAAGAPAAPAADAGPAIKLPGK
ncbi:MAG: tetratricopeptide repeat protein [Verrucomicrobia bacterium]|nr:tetratricopeptide repeat protein [Verrucomicrobiota bacterium]